MGYRSDVAIAVGKYKIAEFEKMYEKECFFPVIKKYENYNVYYWESVKWYLDYSVIKEIMTFLEQLDWDYENKIFPEELWINNHYGFMRVGEETEDIEMLGEPYEYNMYINRSIEF